MAYRFTNTDKWNDSWFIELKPLEKLLFMYLCDSCDIAGFIEVNFRKWAFDLGSTPANIEGATKGLARGLIYSISEDCVFIRNFLKHQKNLPLNIEKNQAHKGIYKRFELYSIKFNILDINEFIEGACKPLARGYGNGIGKGSGNGIEGGCGGKLVKEPKTIPDYSEFRDYAVKNMPTVNTVFLELKYKAWVEGGWKDGKGNTIKNWKTKLLNTLPYLASKESKEKCNINDLKF